MAARDHSPPAIDRIKAGTMSIRSAIKSKSAPATLDCPSLRARKPSKPSVPQAMMSRMPVHNISTVPSWHKSQAMGMAITMRAVVTTLVALNLSDSACPVGLFICCSLIEKECSLVCVFGEESSRACRYLSILCGQPAQGLVILNQIR